jgi:hypothetical protein
MADQLATPEDLASLLQHDLDRATATLLIEASTAAVQAAAGQRIVQVVNDTVVMDLDELDGGQYVILPQWPVTAVTSATIGTTLLNAGVDYVVQLSRGRLWRAYGWRSVLIHYPSQPSTATFVYTHGLAANDQRLQLARSCVLQLAAAGYSNPASGAVLRERIDDYDVQYAAAAGQLEATAGMTIALRRQYGRPRRSVQLTARGHG